MPVYYYRAKNYTGEEITGSYQAADKLSVVYMLKQSNYFPIQIKECKKFRAALWSARMFKRVTVKDLAVFCRQFSTLVNAGVPMLLSLDILRKQTVNRYFRGTLDNIYEDVQKGKSLSQSMGLYRQAFPELLVNMAETGELSGNLDKVMDRMAGHYEKEYKMNQKVKNALIYPAVIGIVAILVVIFLVTMVLPTFVSMFEQMGAVLPLSTRILMCVSHFIRNNLGLLMLLLVSLSAVLKIFGRTSSGRRLFDSLKIRIPVIGNVSRKVATVRFARTFGILTASGIPLLESIEVTKKVINNVIIKSGLSNVKEAVRKGKSLSESLGYIDAFPPILIHMVKVGEDSGTLDYILEKTADFYDDEVEAAVTRMTTLLEPAIIVLMAAVVAFIVISVVVPMFNMMTQVRF